MAKELLINKTLNEIRIALLDNGEILDYLVTQERLDDLNHPIEGNIYQGKVLRVLPGMQSAFIDISYEKAAFLGVDDAYIPPPQEQREIAQKTKEVKVDRIEKKGAIIPDELSTLRENVDMYVRSDVQIEDFIKEGDAVLIQVAKEPISTKGPRVTRHITLAGRYIVYMPFIDHMGVSRRIDNEEERERLKGILENMRPEGVGLIARTIAEKQSSKVLKADYKMLSNIWKEIQEKKAKIKPGQIIYRELSFAERALRDITDDNIDLIYVDDYATFKKLERFINKYLPHMKGKVRQYNQDVPIFEHFDVDIEIERALSNQVYLKSGGSINVDQTEALVSIDVNTGKFVGKKTLEETILKTNLEAVKEIAYQLRIRNCGGIIVIDFIDMEKEEHREKVYNALVEALKKDRAKTNVLPLSELDLVEMTRKRTRDTLTRTMCQPCPYCEGTGKIKSMMTVCYEIMREVTKMAKKYPTKKIFLYAHPEVSAKLCSDDTDIIGLIEKQCDKTIVIRAENNYHLEQYELHSE